MKQITGKLEDFSKNWVMMIEPGKHESADGSKTAYLYGGWQSWGSSDLPKDESGNFTFAWVPYKGEQTNDSDGNPIDSPELKPFNTFYRAKLSNGHTVDVAGAVDLEFVEVVDDEGKVIGVYADPNSFAFNEAKYQAYKATLPDPVPGLKVSKSAEMDSSATNTIFAGTEVSLATTANLVDIDGEPAPVETYKLRDVDQIDIMNMLIQVGNGATEVYYGGNNMPYRAYTAEEVGLLYVQTQFFIQSNLAKANMMKQYIATLTTEDELRDIDFEKTELPKEYQDKLDAINESIHSNLMKVLDKIRGEE